jgi:light-regulated signal transduction histidine kinase (bacteriophytochrome)
VDGTWGWTFSRAIPLLDVNGKIVEWFGTASDVTKRKQAEAEIRRLNSELEQKVVERTAQLTSANKELEAFSYSVSHDLRAPLRHINGFADLMQSDASIPLNDTSRRYLKTIIESAKQMGRLIDDLLSFSRMGRAELQETTINLNQIIQDVLRDIRMDTEGRNIDWKIATLPEVHGDPTLIRQVLVNLVANAVKYTRKRPQAKIEIGQETLNGNDPVFFVRDNGVGFDMKYVEKLFGVFQRLHSSDDFEGTGIGLANVRRIVHRHGGRTWAEGAIDQGASFYFSLPK